MAPAGCFLRGILHLVPSDAFHDAGDQSPER